MAERAYNRRLRPSSSTETPPPRRDASPGLNLVGAFPIVDLDAHPDAKLLRAVTEATKLRDQFELKGLDPFCHPFPAGADKLWRLTGYITDTPAVTRLGCQVKAIFALGDDDPATITVGIAPYASVVRDFLRLGRAAF